MSANDIVRKEDYGVEFWIPKSEFPVRGFGVMAFGVVALGFRV